MSVLDETRLRLKAAGFSPIPAMGKRPLLKEWQKQIDTSEEEIRSWSMNLRTSTNTGVLARDTPALDIDILDAEAVAAAVRLVEERFGSRGGILTRTGLAPKMLIPFRTASPFPKMAIQLRPPNATEGTKPEKLEFLGDGQQFIIAGTHPDTMQPYTWNGGGVPGEVNRKELPEITEAGARELIEDAADLLTTQFGYSRVGQSKPKLKVVRGLEPLLDGSDDHRDSEPRSGTTYYSACFPKT